MKQLFLYFLIFLFPFLSSCAQAEAEKERAVPGESEIITLSDGEKSYVPVANISDLENGVFIQENNDMETVHLEFSTDKKQFIKREHSEHTLPTIYEDAEITTFLDVYEIATENQSFTFIKRGPRIIEDEEGNRYKRIN